MLTRISASAAPANLGYISVIIIIVSVSVNSLQPGIQRLLQIRSCQITTQGHYVNLILLNYFYAAYTFEEQLKTLLVLLAVDIVLHKLAYVVYISNLMCNNFFPYCAVTQTIYTVTSFAEPSHL